jgi:hypothetical protein
VISWRSRISWSEFTPCDAQSRINTRKIGRHACKSWSVFFLSCQAALASSSIKAMNAPQPAQVITETVICRSNRRLRTSGSEEQKGHSLRLTIHLPFLGMLAQSGQLLRSRPPRRKNSTGEGSNTRRDARAYSWLTSITELWHLALDESGSG